MYEHINQDQFIFEPVAGINSLNWTIEEIMISNELYKSQPYFYPAALMYDVIFETWKLFFVIFITWKIFCGFCHSKNSVAIVLD